jgi:hypothetical protein
LKIGNEFAEGVELRVCKNKHAILLAIIMPITCFGIGSILV